MPDSSREVVSRPAGELFGIAGNGRRLLKPGETGRPRPLGARKQAPANPDGAVDISICIAGWNCRDLLRQCLQSIHDQDHGVSLETIVVDNASSDGADDMVAEEFPEVLLIRNPRNRGFSKANNQAAQEARGRYLFFLNNDTVVPPGTLKRLVEYFDEHPETGMLGPRLRGVDGELQVSYRPRPTLGSFLHRTCLFRWLGLWRGAYQTFRRQAFDPHASRTVDVLMGAAVVVERRRFLEWGGWDEDFAFGGEDMELSYRIARHAPLVFLPDVEVLHYGSISTRQCPAASTKIALGFLQYFRKTGSSRPALWGYKLAVTIDAPVQAIARAVQYVWRSFAGQKRRAAKSRAALAASRHFLVRGLLPFWKT